VIAFQTATPTATTDQGSTSISVAYPANSVAARHIAVLAAVVKDATATFDDPSGWTKIGEKTGGEGTAGDDVGTTKIAVWIRILDGTESGSVTVTNTGGVSSAGLITVYAPTDGFAFTLIDFVSGSDDTHAADWNPAGFGTWPQAVAVNDWVLTIWGSDTDVTQSISARSLTQTGITWVGNFFRCRSCSTTGPDCGIYQGDWRVNAGSNDNAPSYTHTTGTATCGPMMIVRLRETAVSGQTTVLRSVVVAP
jgi:hypothetical protein